MNTPIACYVPHFLGGAGEQLGPPAKGLNCLSRVCAEGHGAPESVHKVDLSSGENGDFIPDGWNHRKLSCILQHTKNEQYVQHVADVQYVVCFVYVHLLAGHHPKWQNPLCGGCSKPSLVWCIMPTNLSNLNKPLPQGSLMLGLLELTKTHSSLLKPSIWFVILKLLDIINQLIHQGFFIPHELVGMLWNGSSQKWNCPDS